MVKDTSMGQNVMLFHVLFRKLFVHIYYVLGWPKAGCNRRPG